MFKYNNLSEGVQCSWTSGYYNIDFVAVGNFSLLEF